jgi:hypothetical protein
MANPYRSTCTISGESFDCVSIRTSISTQPDQNSMPLMSSMQTDIECLIDFHDDTNVPNTVLRTIFNLAAQPKTGQYLDIKLEYWQDETRETALCSYSFKGWISSFRAYNPNGQEKSPNAFNHAWILALQPALNTQNYKLLSMGN